MFKSLLKGILLKTRFDKKHNKVSYPYYACEVCNNAFYGGGDAIHKEGCSEKGKNYSGYGPNVVMVFGPKQVEVVLEHAKDKGDDFDWYGITRGFLKRHYPQLVT